jgi:hypothetical protein
LIKILEQQLDNSKLKQFCFLQAKEGNRI